MMRNVQTDVGRACILTSLHMDLLHNRNSYTLQTFQSTFSCTVDTNPIRNPPMPCYKESHGNVRTLLWGKLNRNSLRRILPSLNCRKVHQMAHQRALQQIQTRMQTKEQSKEHTA